MKATLDRRSIALQYDVDESLSEHMPGTLLATMMLFCMFFNVGAFALVIGALL